MMPVNSLAIIIAANLNPSTINTDMNFQEYSNLRNSRIMFHLVSSEVTISPSLSPVGNSNIEFQHH